MIPNHQPLETVHLTVSPLRLDSVHGLLLSSSWLVHQYLTRGVAIEFMSLNLMLHLSSRDCKIFQKKLSIGKSD